MDWLISNPENPKGSDDSWHFNFGTYFANCDLLYLLQTKIKHFYFWPNTLLWRTHHQRKRLFSETKKPVRLELGVLATPDTSIILILMQCYRVLLFYKKYESHISFFTGVWLLLLQFTLGTNFYELYLNICSYNSIRGRP